MERIINYNGQFADADTAILKAGDHGYRYGDGLFETMKVMNEKIMFETCHLDRLFHGLKILKFNVADSFNSEKIRQDIIALCKKNNCERSARVRLSVSRGNGGLYDCDNDLSWLIECWPQETGDYLLNGNGLVIGVFPDARKSIDAFSNLKSANYLPYTLAAVWAIENKLDDALVLNQHHRVCDASIANVFWVKDGKIFSPPLSEGCVAGVMRRKIIELNPKISEAVLTEEGLKNADEVFLTNIMGIRWVKQCGNKTYGNAITNKIFVELTETVSS